MSPAHWSLLSPWVVCFSLSLRTYEEGRGVLLVYYTVNLKAWESERSHLV